MAEVEASPRISELPAIAPGLIAAIPIAFEVKGVAAVRTGSDGSLTFEEVAVARRWTKDYDALPGNDPRAWGERFDLAQWGQIVARDGDAVRASVLIARDTPGLDMLEGRVDLALIWDLRIAPDRRGQGIGRALVQAAEVWALKRECRELRVETQDVNLPACRFYAAQGFRLIEAHRGAYVDCPDETQLIWSKAL